MLTREYALSQLIPIEEGWMCIESDNWPARPEETIWMNCFHSDTDEKPKHIIMLNWNEDIGYWVDIDNGRRFADVENAIKYLVRRYNAYWFRQLRKMLREREAVAQ